LEGATPDRDISLHNFSTRLWEQLVHFHVMWLTHWLFLWVGAMPHLCNLTVALCSHYDSIPVSEPAACFRFCLQLVLCPSPACALPLCL
uniref:Uncharacterized protein n=1 Tax=Panthera tigris altaica TaxID=74533 RepID=A0A8C9JAJ0_PANTA